MNTGSKIDSRGGKRPGAGRPKGSTAISAELREAAQEHTQDALAVIVEVMHDNESPQRLKAAQLILERGHGAPREEPASVDIISKFVDGKLSAIAACLMLESKGLKVPETMREFFRNEIERATYVPFGEMIDVLNSLPKELPRK